MGMQADPSIPIDALALVTHQMPVEMHHHHAVQMVVSLDNPYPATLDGQRQESIQGFLIGANIPHACQSAASTVLVVSVDADTVRGKALRRCLDGRSFVLLEELVAAEKVHRFCTSYWSDREGATRRFDPLALAALLSGNPTPQFELDMRVRIARDYIAQHLSRTLRLQEIADAAALSESRLRHLFVHDTGIPVTTYVLWMRMKVALHGLVNLGMSLAEAAHHAGYADHAHFTRTFLRMFGVSPSLILKHSQFIRIFDIPSQGAMITRPMGTGLL
jgi:AraC-like DNA-binding protein